MGVQEARRDSQKEIENVLFVGDLAASAEFLSMCDSGAQALLNLALHPSLSITQRLWPQLFPLEYKFQERMTQHLV